MFLTDFCMQKYTRGIISWVGIFLTVTLVIYNSYTIYNYNFNIQVACSVTVIQKHMDIYYSFLLYIEI